MNLENLEKDYYSIGEAARILQLEQHVVRFWSNTFAKYIKPVRRAGDRRYYSKYDIETLAKIKELVYTNKYSLNGVQIVLDSLHTENEYLNNEENTLDYTKKIKQVSIIKDEITKIREQIINILSEK